MPVAPPPNDEWGFWPLVQSLVRDGDFSAGNVLGLLGGLALAPIGGVGLALGPAGEAIGTAIGDGLAHVFGWPDADEDALREVLAVAWDDLGTLADDIAKAANDQVPVVAANWPDYAGGKFNYSLSTFGSAEQGGAGATGKAAHDLAQAVRDYAVQVKYTKEQIVWEVALNLPFYAATFATGPAGWAAAAIARFLISRGTARLVSSALTTLATRAAASTFPKALAPLTLRELPGHLVKGAIVETGDELLATIPPLINNDLLNTDFGRQQMQQAALGGALGEPVSRIVGKPFGIAGGLAGRGLDRAGAPGWVQRQGSTLVSSFGTNAISSPISSQMAINMLNGNWAGLLDVQGYGKALGDNWLGSGVHGSLRANGVAGANDLSQVATTALGNRFGVDLQSYHPSTNPATAGALDPATAPAAVGKGAAATVAQGSAATTNAGAVNTAPGDSTSSHVGGAAQNQTATAEAPPSRAVHQSTHHDTTQVRPGDADSHFTASDDSDLGDHEIGSTAEQSALDALQAKTSVDLRPDQSVTDLTRSDAGVQQSIDAQSNEQVGPAAPPQSSPATVHNGSATVHNAPTTAHTAPPATSAPAATTSTSAPAATATATTSGSPSATQIGPVAQTTSGKAGTSTADESGSALGNDRSLGATLAEGAPAASVDIKLDGLQTKNESALSDGITTGPSATSDPLGAVAVQAAPAQLPVAATAAPRGPADQKASGRPTHTRSSHSGNDDAAKPEAKNGPTDDSPPSPPPPVKDANGQDGNESEFGWFDPASPVVDSEGRSGVNPVWSKWHTFGANEARWLEEGSGLGRVAQARLRATYPKTKRSRDDARERDRARKRGVKDDQGGHSIGWRFFQDAVPSNYFPQNKALNNGAFKSFENEIEQWILAGHHVELTVFLSPDQGRPDSVTFVYTVVDPASGRAVYTSGRSFENQPHKKVDRFPTTRIRVFAPGNENLFDATSPAEGHHHSHGAPEGKGWRSNQDVFDNGGGVERTAAAVAEAAAAAGVDLTATEVVIVDGPAEIRYLDAERAYARVRVADGSYQIRLGPASFAGRETLVATLAHEQTHVDQLRAGVDFDKTSIDELENEAYASEAPALERMRAHDNGEVRGRDDVRPGGREHDSGSRPTADRTDHGRHDTADGGNGPTGEGPGSGVPLFRRAGGPNERGDAGDRSRGRDGDRDRDGSGQPGLTNSGPQQQVIRGSAESLLWFSGTGRLLPNWQAVEKQIHAAFANSDVLEAADIESVRRVPGYRNRYEVKPKNGTSFEVTIRAATVEDGHPGEFVAPKDGSYPATLTVSNRANDNAVTRTVANLLHQLAHAGRTGPDVLRPGAEAKLNTRLSRADGGRLAEARLLEIQLGKTPAYRLVRRQDRRNDIRALMEHLGVARGQKDAEWRQSLPELQRLRSKPSRAGDSDGRMLDRMTKGWAAGDDRPRTRVYLARELIAAGVPVTAGSVGLAIAENVATALAYGVPLVAAAAITGLAQRWLDGHKNAVKAERGLAHQKEAAKRNPGILNRLESDPYGVAGQPVEELDASTLTPKSLRYRLRHTAPGVVAVGLSTVLTGAVQPAIAVYYAASAVLKPITEKFVDGRRSKLKVLRREEWIARVAADPLRYQNELADFLEQLGHRLNQATGALARTAGEPGSVGYRALARAEVTDVLPDAFRRLLPREPNARETDPTTLATYLDSYGEILIVGALNNLASALASAGVTAYVERQNDKASDASYRFDLDLVENAEARALFEGVQADVTRLVELVALVEAIAAQAHDPAKVKLLSRALDRFRQARPPVTAVPEGPAPAPAPDLDQEPKNTPSYRVQALFTIPPALTVAGVNIADAVVGLNPSWFTAIVFAATAAVFAAPMARWLAVPQESKHVRHAADADNLRAIDQQRAADHLGAVMFLMQLRENELLARAEALRPDARPALSKAFGLFRAVDLLFRGQERAADFTDRVRGAVRMARLTITPSDSLSARAYRHSALDRIEQYADRVDDAADAVRRKVPGARTVLRTARQELVAAMQAHAAKFTDGRGSLPDLGTVDPATGARVTGDPLTRARAAAAESWRRMLAEDGSTRLLAQRVIALTRVRNALEVLARELASGDNERVKLANNELNRYADEFRELQRQASVVGDPRIVTAALQLQVKAFLGRRPPDGNAAMLGEFVADGPVQDHGELMRQVIRALQDSGMRWYAGVTWAVVLGDTPAVQITTQDGQLILVKFSVGPVDNSHPAEFRLTGETEYAVVRISEQIKPDDVARAVVHELRELSRLADGRAGPLTPHEQGRLGELLYLEDQLWIAEETHGPDLARRARYHQKMREIMDDLRLAKANQQKLVEQEIMDLLERYDPGRHTAWSPYTGPIRLDEDWRDTHIIGRHGYGTAPKADKFNQNFDLTTLEDLARQVIANSPHPVRKNPVLGTRAYDFDFGRIIGSDGQTKVRVWIDPDGNVKTVHPVKN